MTAAKDSEGKAQTGWNNVQTSTSLPQDAAANNASCSVSQSHAETPTNDDTDDQLTKGITIYRSYSNVAKAEAEVQPYGLAAAGVRLDLSCRRQWLSA